MKKEYDFDRGRRGAVLSAPPGKTRITIRVDDDILPVVPSPKAQGRRWQLSDRAEAPGHLALIIPILAKHLFEERGFKFREI